MKTCGLLVLAAVTAAAVPARAQTRAARAMIAGLEHDAAYPRPIATEVVPFERFYAAEAYHQDYLAHHRTSPYIVYNDLPKLAQLKERLPELYRP